MGAGVSFYADDASDVLEIVGSTISNNVAQDSGGGGAIGGLDVKSSSDDAVLTIANTTISGNQAAGGTGAIFVEWHAHLTIVNSTITNNEALSGTVGGIMVNDSDSVVTLYNTIVAGNIDHLWSGLHRDVGKNSGSYDAASSNNLIGVVGWSGLSTTTNLTGTETTPLDSGLAPLADYGGPTKTHALLDGSPAIDAGDGSKATAYAAAVRSTRLESN